MGCIYTSNHPTIKSSQEMSNPLLPGTEDDNQECVLLIGSVPSGYEYSENYRPTLLSNLGKMQLFFANCGAAVIGIHCDSNGFDKDSVLKYLKDFIGNQYQTLIIYYTGVCLPKSGNWAVNPTRSLFTLPKEDLQETRKIKAEPALDQIELEEIVTIWEKGIETSKKKLLIISDCCGSNNWLE